MINLSRRKMILDILATENTINTKELSERLGVTGATIRTDLRDLAKEGAIERYHGGVRLPHKPTDIGDNYMVRSVTHVDLKRKIGCAAAKLVDDGSTIFMDASSTTFHMIPYLVNRQDVTVVTNGINTAMELQRYNDFKSIILLGGMLRPHSGSIEGVMSREIVSRLKAEFYFVSGNGFSIESGLSGNNFYELELKKLCASRCRSIVALVDSTKMGIDSASSFIPAADIDYLVTDDDADEEFLKACEMKGIKVIVSSES